MSRGFRRRAPIREATPPYVATTKQIWALYDAIRGVSAAFPFKATLDALDAGLNDAGGLAGPLIHLAALTVAFGVLSRLALRRFAV